MKILIYFNKNALKPIGGPAGYLYNLMKFSDPEIVHFLDDPVSGQHRKAESLPIPQFAKRYLKDLNWRKISWNRLNKKSHMLDKADLAQYDCIHFHSTTELYLCRDQIAGYKGKIVLTSHTPKVSYREICEDWISKREYRMHKRFYDSLEKVDRFAFERADTIVFPCPEAEEPYYNTWKTYKEMDDILRPKKRYVLSGIEAKTVTSSRADIRSKLGIPEDAFVLCYVGRHAAVKGYDTFLKLWENYKDCENVYFLACGNAGDFTVPDHKRWIEIGWTNQAADYINAADVFMLPNKETFFDLVMLEVLSIGTPIIASYTGGNKYFERYDSGIMLYKTYAEMISYIDLMRSDPGMREDYRNKNTALFANEFTNKIFADNYIKLMEEIVSE